MEESTGTYEEVQPNENMKLATENMKPAAQRLAENYRRRNPHTKCPGALHEVGP
jgi:hypothetical protein